MGETSFVPSPAIENNTKAYTQCVFIVQPSYKHFLMSKFADGKNIQFMISHFIETYLVDNSNRYHSKTQGSLRWGTETMEVESGSRHDPIILLSARTSSTKLPLLSLLSYL